jgi:hypothetical protein
MALKIIGYANLSDMGQSASSVLGRNNGAIGQEQFKFHWVIIDYSPKVLVHR